MPSSYILTERCSEIELFGIWGKYPEMMKFSGLLYDGVPLYRLPEEFSYTEIEELTKMVKEVEDKYGEFWDIDRVIAYFKSKGITLADKMREIMRIG